MQTYLNILFSSFFFASTLHAQDAMGTGNALDNNLSTSGRENIQRTLPRGTTNQEIRTNSILAGRSFNEGVGLGTKTHLQLISDAGAADAEMLADTLNNSPWYWDNWTNPSAQFILQGDSNYFNSHFIDNWAQSPMSVRIGQSMQSINKSWSSQDDYSDQTAKLQYPSTWSQGQVKQHELARATGGTYDPMQGTWAATPVGTIRSQGGSGYITASPLRGVAVETTNHTAAFGLTPWDAARAAEDRENGVGTETLVNRWVVNTGLLDHRANEHQQEAKVHTTIVDAVQSRTTDQLATNGLLNNQPEGWIDQQYDRLLGQLAGVLPYDEEEEWDVVDDSSEETGPEEDAMDEIALILQHGQRIEQLESKDQTRFNELMVLAAERFANGEYFWAERRYDRALRFTPGHPLATAGLGHSRIGAGLYLSASLALQSLLSLQPEMIDVEYADTLLPPRLELVKAAVELTSRLNEKRDGGTYGFLLAYIGHQLGDKEMIERGLAVFEEREGGNDPFVRLLKDIWL
ncbi:MAG: hypothetical protein QGI78_01080 [Phycisphaerales bacterium]|nr:hypothetical protein [Phycisphaerales bacterium]